MNVYCNNTTAWPRFGVVRCTGHFGVYGLSVSLGPWRLWIPRRFRWHSTR